MNQKEGNKYIFEDFSASNVKGLRPVTPADLTKHLTPRRLLSNIVLPSQYASYATCVEFTKKWFLEKFPEHFFNSIYVDGKHSFDEFRQFAEINQQLRRSNPLLAIFPDINLSHNRDWIDANPELQCLMRRSRMEGTFFDDIMDNRGLHLQIQFKTILMNFTFKIRVDTRGEELDMIEYIKYHHRAGFTETRNINLDVHVPRDIISQIAWHNDIRMDDTGKPVDSVEMLHYLNSHSVIPFLYKLRCATGNNEYFIKVPNCVAHIKTELPTGDTGERSEMITTNYNIDFNVEVEMTAPYCYNYYSQREQPYLLKMKPIDNTKHQYIGVMQSIMTDVPPEDEHHWKMVTEEPIQYQIDEINIDTEIDIDFMDMLKDTDMYRVIQYTLGIKIDPYIFMNFKVFNDGIQCGYRMNWDKMIMHVNKKATNQIFVIGVYCDMGYVNETLIHIHELDLNSDRV